MKLLLTTTLCLGLANLAMAQELSISRAGERPVTQASAENFTGKAEVEMLFRAEAPARSYGGLVRFESGARTDWHTHPLGQTLIVTAGVGRVQMWGGPVQEIKKGDVVNIPPNVKHWHGASPEVSMEHLALGERQDGKSVEWMEKVSDEQFHASLPGESEAEEKSGPSRAQQLLGGVAPKLAELTDDVLYADVWERPELSKRDRSLATVSALIAMNRPNQLRSHMSIALRNGVTEEELSEVITHLAFYSGWPSSVDAVGVAKEVFEDE